MALGTAWASEGTLPETPTGNLLFSNIISNLCYVRMYWNQFYSYNIATQTWTKLANMPTGYFAYGYMIYRQGKVYCVMDPTSQAPYGAGRYLGIYDIAGNSWTVSAIATTGGKTYLLTTYVFTDDDTIWVWGYYSTEVRCLKYVISTNTWTAYANSTTTAVTENAAMNDALTIVFGGKLNGAYCKYTVATDTYTEVGDIGRDFGICTDDDKLWYNAEATPWAKGYLLCNDETLHDTVLPGNTGDALHRLFGVENGITMGLNYSKNTSPERVDSIAQTPTVTSDSVSDIGPTSARGHGNVTALGTRSVSAHGFVWALTANPTTNPTDEGAKTSSGTFDTTMTGFSSGSGYYSRAYATNPWGTVYGADIYFVTGGFGGVDASIQVDFTKGAHNDCILFWRFTDTSNYLYVRSTATALEIRKVEVGVDSLVATTVHSWSAGVAMRVRVFLHGNNIYVFVAELVTTTTWSLVVSGVDDLNNTSTTHGIGGPAVNSAARWDNFGGYRNLFYGKIDDIDPVPDVDRKVAYIRASDDLRTLANTALRRRNSWSEPASSASTTWGYVASIIYGVGNIFGNADPYGHAIYDAGVSIVLSIKAYWDVYALGQIQRIEAEENGFFYQDQMGFWRFEGRTHRDGVPHNAPIVTIYGDESQGDLFFDSKGFKWLSGRDGVLNYIAADVYQSLADPVNPVEIWRCSEADVVDGGVASSTLSIPAGGSVVLYFETRGFDAVASLINPTVVGLDDDYAANAAANGSGVDKTAQLTVTLAYDWNAYYGRGGKLTLANSDAGTIYVTKLIVRGDGYSYGDKVTAVAEDATSRSNYGEKRLSIPCDLLLTRSEAQSLADSVEAKYDDPRDLVEGVIKNVSKNALMHLLGLQVSDRVTVNYTQMPVSADFYINGKSFMITDGGKDIACRLLLEKIPA